MLDDPDEDVADATQRSLLRVENVDAPAREAFAGAAPRARSRICRLIAKGGASEQHAPWLAEVLAGDADEGVRKGAARALGHAKNDAARDGLVAAWRRETSLPVLRAIAESLGKIGDSSIASVLDAVPGHAETDAELARIVGKARLMIERTASRGDARSTLDATRAPIRPLAVRFRCRAGLAPLVASELAALAPKIVSPSEVDATLAAPLSTCFVSRCALDFGFVVPAVRVQNDDVAGAVVLALDAARPILAELDAPPFRFRLSWAGGGHRRGTVWKIAEKARAASADLVNDPTASTWEIVVRERRRGPEAEVSLLLVPVALADPRFAYRVTDVPAASHPTLAAALARIAGVRDDDVVWDPFAGSGTELVERAKLGPWKRAIASDLDAKARAAAKANLAAAGVAADVVDADALEHSPGPVTLILTNPPLGRRVHRDADLRDFFDRFLGNAARALAPSGRIAWISPLPHRTAERARELGLVHERGIDVDMGGFSAQIQLLSRPPAKSR